MKLVHDHLSDELINEAAGAWVPSNSLYDNIEAAYEILTSEGTCPDHEAKYLQQEVDSLKSS